MYKLNQNFTSITHIADGAIIPDDPANTDYAAYVQWLAEGNSPEPADIPAPTIPQSVTRRQARQALLLSGNLSLVQPAIDAIPDATQRGLMQIEWDDSQEFERNRPSLIAIGGAIGLDAAGIDELFVQAAAL